MPTATQITYLHLCHRKLWLFSHGINMEYTSDLVAEGKLIDENSYANRAVKWQALQIEGIKIDHFDPVHRIVREVKKSNKRSDAHKAQVLYYLFVLERNGIEVSHGLLEYPKLKKTEEVWLSNVDREEIPNWENQVTEICNLEICPPRIKQSLCKHCAYYDFCYADEINE